MCVRRGNASGMPADIRCGSALQVRIVTQPTISRGIAPRLCPPSDNAPPKRGASKGLVTRSRLQVWIEVEARDRALLDLDRQLLAVLGHAEDLVLPAGRTQIEDLGQRGGIDPAGGEDVRKEGDPSGRPETVAMRLAARANKGFLEFR